MLYRNKNNNQHTHTHTHTYIKNHDSICINNLNIYIISHVYEKLFTHLTQKRTELESKYQRKSY
jgi:hypothetical protein